MNYNGFWFSADKNICKLIKSYDVPTINGIWFVENHDTVTDLGRVENMFPSKVCDCLYVYNFTTFGTPLIYGGEEIADKNPHNMFANKEYNRGYGVDWSNALLPNGKHRLKLIERLSNLRKTEDVLAYGTFSWLETQGDLLAFERNYNGETISVFINFSKLEYKVEAKGEILLSRGYKQTQLKTSGFVIFKHN